MSMEELRHELLSDVASHTAGVLSDHGIEHDVAEQAGVALANHLAEHWGGQLITFPKDHFFKLASRDLQIFNEFTGNNHSDLARKYRLCTRAIYKIIERVTKREIDKRQGKLFV